MPNTKSSEEIKVILKTFTQSEAGKKLMADLEATGKYLPVTYINHGLCRDLGFLSQNGWGIGLHNPDLDNLQGSEAITVGEDAVTEIAAQMVGALVGCWTNLEQARSWLENATAFRDGVPLGEHPSYVL